MAHLPTPSLREAPEDPNKADQAGEKPMDFTEEEATGKKGFDEVALRLMVWGLGFRLCGRGFKALGFMFSRFVAGFGSGSDRTGFRLQ